MLFICSVIKVCYLLDQLFRYSVIHSFSYSVIQLSISSSVRVSVAPARSPRLRNDDMVQSFGCWISGFGCGGRQHERSVWFRFSVSGVSGFGFRVSGFGFRGCGFRGFGFRADSDAVQCYGFSVECLAFRIKGIYGCICSSQKVTVYRGTSLIRKRPPLGPYSSRMPRGLGWSCGGGRLLMSKVTLYVSPEYPG